MNQARSTWKEPTSRILAVLLAVMLGAVGVFHLVRYQATVEQFARFGYEPWFVFVTVAVELATAVLLVPPRTRPYGTTMSIVTLIAAMLSHLKAEQPAGMLWPLVPFILACVLAWIGPVDSDQQEEGADATVAGKQKRG